MKTFLDDDFLLENPTAAALFHQYAENIPIIDYHCHISPKEIAENKKYETITQIWLGGDHYKWRMMRYDGVPEKYITGDCSDYEKFEQWSKVLPRCVGNPLYHWSYMELKRYFGFDGELTADNAREVYALCNKQLTEGGLSTREIILCSGVKVLCTTDDPIDSLEYHQQISDDKTFPVQVLPAFRPDKAMNIDRKEFAPYINQLSEVSGVSIHSFNSLCEALAIRMKFFHKMGCRISDHALESCVCEPAAADKLDQILLAGMEGRALTAVMQEQFKTALLAYLASQYHQLGWAMQLHYGCIRNNNTKMYEKIGPDTGFDAITRGDNARKLSEFLNLLEIRDALPKMIIYPLDAGDNDMIMSLCGCFQSDEVPGKIQLGSAWWFHDNKAGMTSQLTSLANLGLLSNFVGMLSDSRSFLSYIRHEYFRRILCNLIGGWVEKGECHANMAVLGSFVQDISYNNAQRYFDFDTHNN